MFENLFRKQDSFRQLEKRLGKTRGEKRELKKRTEYMQAAYPYRRREQVSKNAHLKEGVPPLIACIGEVDKDSARFNSLIAQGSNLDWTSGTSRAEGAISTREYLISQIDTSVKYSEGYRNCTGLVVVGIDKTTGENISFITHQNGFYIFGKMKTLQKFEDDVRSRLAKMKEACVPGTIDAALMGGSASGMSIPENLNEQHRDMMLFAGEMVNAELGFYPQIISEQRKYPDEDEQMLLIDTQRRQLYIKKEQSDEGEAESLHSHKAEDWF